MNPTYAGFWVRFVALVIDGIIIGIIRSFLIVPLMVGMGVGVVSDLANHAKNMDSEKPEQLLAMLGPLLALAGIVSIISTIVWVLYYTLMESSKFQASVGKLAMGIIVTDLSGAKLDFGKALARNLCKIISGSIMLIGFIMAGFTEKKQALHDIIAGTLVVKKTQDVSIGTN